MPNGVRGAEVDGIDSRIDDLGRLGGLLEDFNSFYPLILLKLFSLLISLTLDWPGNEQESNKIRLSS